MISLKHKFLFVHTPKTGGTSIEAVISDYCEWIRDNDGGNPIQVVNARRGKNNPNVRSDYDLNVKHWGVRRYSNRWDTRGFYKFTVTRNTWDRLVSFFFMQLKGASKEYTQERFVEFVDSIENKQASRGGSAVWIPKKISFLDNETAMNLNTQSRMLALGDVRVGEEMDYIIDFRELQKGFDKVCSEIKADEWGDVFGDSTPLIKNSKLPHVNKGWYVGSSKMHYTEYYTDRTRDIIADVFKEEIDYFDYKFGD